MMRILLPAASSIGGTILTLGVALFLPAGTLDWAAAWVFLGLYFAFMLVGSLWLMRRSPGLLHERLTGIGKPGQSGWDKVFFAVFFTIFFAWFVLMGLDAGRFHWSHMPVWLQAAGALMLVGAFALLLLTARENPYLSPAVRIQSERGQAVISTGPYRYVRHPMYAAMVPHQIGIALLLGSWWGLLCAPVFIAGLAVRAVFEERVLRAGLPGYADYMAKVKRRFIPGLW